MHGAREILSRPNVAAAALNRFIETSPCFLLFTKGDKSTSSEIPELQMLYRMFVFADCMAVIPNFTQGTGSALIIATQRDYLRLRRSPAQADTMEQVLKPWIGPQRIEARPHAYLGIEALRIGVFQPGHGLIFVVQP